MSKQKPWKIKRMSKKKIRALCEEIKKAKLICLPAAKEECVSEVSVTKGGYIFAETWVNKALRSIKPEYDPNISYKLRLVAIKKDGE